MPPEFTSTSLSFGSFDIVNRTLVTTIHATRKNNTESRD